MSLASYRRIRTLGSGAYGEAVLVERRADGAQLVVKELHASHLSASELEKAQQEALVLKRLSHSNIICLVDSFMDGGGSDKEDKEGGAGGGKFCIVTDFADRGDLAAFIKERRDARARALEIFRVTSSLPSSATAPTVAASMESEQARRTLLELVGGGKQGGGGDGGSISSSSSVASSGSGGVGSDSAVGGFEEDEVLSIFVQLCRALRHVHRLNILHRDLKAQNVFLSSSVGGPAPPRRGGGGGGGGGGVGGRPRLVVKLGDFGIAKAMSNTLSLAETQIGTPYYLSPEIYEDQPYGKKSDVWSLGVLLHEVAALELPFQAKNLAALARRVLTQPPKPLPSHALVLPDAALQELSDDHHPLLTAAAAASSPSPLSSSSSSSSPSPYDSSASAYYAAGAWAADPVLAPTRPELQQLVHSLLTREPKDRPSAADVLASPFVMDFVRRHSGGGGGVGKGGCRVGGDGGGGGGGDDDD